ncbi:MAG TPA: hypothetical protein VLM79_10880 [Kofleriaceae bacterium]|nr:hypothetical protein [Kofleriaceae bacterium]
MTVHVLSNGAHPPPDHLTVEPGSGVAVNVTTWPKSKSKSQVSPQLMPAGLDVTVPLPKRSDLRMTVRVRTSSNVAFTVVAALIVVVQVPVPLQPPPDQPVKVEPGDALAVSVTT